jgi:N utilization substance protein A
MDINEVLEALELVAREKGVPTDTILDALANALVSAYKRTPGAAEEARVTIDADSGEILVYGQELDEDGNVTREWEDTPDDFGRIAATTAKQVIVQRLRDAKREQVFDIYEGREGDLVTGIIQQSDHRYAMLDLGDAEAGKGPQIVVSRSHPEFIRSLFELEVPELVDGDVEIKAIAREPGHRTKIAVLSNDPNVDPVGACVGARGSRVRQVVNELRGEKVDIVEWREDTAAFAAEALSPARVKEVRLDNDEMVATVIVPDHQLSLAIGKEGQNARLAARLTGYKIDIRSESEDLGLLPTDEEDAALAAAEEAAFEGAVEAVAEEVPEAALEGAADEADTAAGEVPEMPAADVAEDIVADAASPDSPDSPDSPGSPDSIDSPDAAEGAEKVDVVATADQDAEQSA